LELVLRIFYAIHVLHVWIDVNKYKRHSWRFDKVYGHLNMKQAARQLVRRLKALDSDRKQRFLSLNWLIIQVSRAP
jgi:hypothetical protein